MPSPGSTPHSRRSSSSTGRASSIRTSASQRSIARSSSYGKPGSLRQLVRDGRPTYVRCHAGHHHHLICTACGVVEETELCAAPSAAELRKRHGFRAQEHQVDIFGLCERCG